MFGAQRYNIVAFKKFFQRWKQYSGVISFEDSLGQMISFTSEYVMATISNHQVQNSNNNEVVMPFAKINDGKLDLMIMFFIGKFKSLSTFMQMQKNGAHQDNKSVNFIKTSVVVIEPKNLMVYNVDGEIFYANSISIQIVPKLVNYLGKPSYI